MPDVTAAARRRDNPLMRLVTGAVILTIGVILWLDHAGRVNARDYLRWASAIMIAYGLAHIAERRWVAAALMTFFGVMFLPPVRAMVELDIRAILGLWPLFISVAGVSLIAQALRPVPKDARQDGASFRALAVMGGNNRTMNAEEFSRGDVVAVMGGVEIDIRSSPPGAIAVIDVLTFWGGVDIRVPRGWVVENQVFALLAALEDKTTAPPAANAPRLIVRGTAIMAGIEVRNHKEETV